MNHAGTRRWATSRSGVGLLFDTNTWYDNRYTDTRTIKCVVFDFGYTLSSDPYFKLIGPSAFKYADDVMSGKTDPHHIVEDWMAGLLSSYDVAVYLSKRVGLPPGQIQTALVEGCRQIEFNTAVWEFAQQQHRLGRKTAVVTGNFDVFIEVIVPARGLDNVFDAIVNSSDYGLLDKESLWPIAFKLLGDGYGYSSSLLIEDTAYEVRRFRELGGAAYQYSTDEALCRWMNHEMKAS